MLLFGNEQRSRKRFRRATDRACSPQETVERFGPLMPTMGITRLANVTGLDRLGLPVYMAVRPNSRSLAVSQGKGFDASAAKASALMESIELWHAENVSLDTVMASYSSLSGRARVVDVTALPRPKGVELDLDAEIAWVQGRDLVTDEPIWVPFEIICQDHLAPIPGRSMFLQSSNGLASGNELLEAITHGLCELVERDATCLWNLDGDSRRTKALQLDPSTIADPSCQELLERVAEANATMAMWDLTSDLGIPTYGCLVLDNERWRAKTLTHGYGCHPSPRIALARAMTEAAQCRLTEIAGSRDDIPLEQYTDERVDPARMQRVLRYLRRRPPLDFRARESLATDDFEGDLQAILPRLRAAGMDTVAVVDLSRPELGVPVVHVVVPGLEADIHGADLEPGARARARIAELVAETASRGS